MRICVYPGSFDPVTSGHMDIIERASAKYDKMIVGVLINRAKMPMFSIEERIDMLKRSTAHLKNVEIDGFDGLLVDYCRSQQASTIIRGLRAITDFEAEFSMASMNKILAPDIETLFLMTSTRWSYLSSSSVKEIAAYGGNIEAFVPKVIHNQVKETIQSSIAGGK